jgi:signal transduction histidine kinase
VAAALEDLIRETDVVADELRRIAHGVSPPLLLATIGLVAAPSAEDAHSAARLRISIAAIRPQRARHRDCRLPELSRTDPERGQDAGPGASVTIQPQREGHQLGFTVHDSGRGFDPRRTTEV